MASKKLGTPLIGQREGLFGSLQSVRTERRNKSFAGRIPNGPIGQQWFRSNTADAHHPRIQQAV